MIIIIIGWKSKCAIVQNYVIVEIGYSQNFSERDRAYCRLFYNYTMAYSLFKLIKILFWIKYWYLIQTRTLLNFSNNYAYSTWCLFSCCIAHEYHNNLTICWFPNHDWSISSRSLQSNTKKALYVASFTLKY